MVTNDLGSRLGVTAVALTVAYVISLPFITPDSRRVSRAFRAAPASLAGIGTDHGMLEPVSVRRQFVAAAFVPEARVVSGLPDEDEGEPIPREALDEMDSQIPTPSLTLLQGAAQNAIEKPASLAGIDEFLALDEEAFEMDEADFSVPELTEDSGHGTSFTFRKHTTRKGETIRQIAAHYRVAPEHLEVINAMKADRVLPANESILVPVGLGTVHIVGKKETVFAVAKHYNLKASTVLFFNRSHAEDLTLKPAEQLYIPLGSIDMKDAKEIASNTPIRNLLENKLMFTWPLHGRLSSRFGWRIHPIYHRGRMHKGIDIAVPTGTPIKAAERGRVLWATWKGGSGLCVIVEHPNGLHSYYMHCSKILVKRGQWVSRRQVIAKVGETGLATGPHLHFSLQRDGDMINPLKYLALKQL